MDHEKTFAEILLREDCSGNVPLVQTAERRSKTLTF